MDKQYLHEKLDAMRQNFVESTHHERAVGVLDQPLPPYLLAKCARNGYCQ
ncbi:Uncharacterised protein [Streptococcus pneumoniae]|uniref:Uncharacterized protein n=1 Tax=Streptococcus pneumoniae TaxID=1313 RepID=A0A4J2AZR2_STREE|nr:hypothetical protein CGSSp14BS292_08335 [Streptococcus pneumoniae SP14-BS292]EFL69307.1 hypothetical protein CGSSpBS293_03948 [Streptococcus pneumoniae SP-BS293]EFL71096.1 hypothetical protein CGSSpBS458_01924 [Streptococcus pneumoniae BS458]EFL74380.1 hypothetical protein CGSSpBS457_04787 [Streptococcus pneumoniae BS457]EFL76629.1 hypothetical protein CGSSpBS397_05307 [Streptococcus pneumoniae BS397]EJH03830.1 hypothetical protein SPAR160_2037 [Streptococcus pneumoniae GA58581]CAG5731272.